MRYLATGLDRNGNQTATMSPKIKFPSVDSLRSLGLRMRFPTEHLGRMEIRLKSTPDWLRRGIRLSIALVLFGLLGHAIQFPATWGASLQSEVKQACNWAAITCIVSCHAYTRRNRTNHASWSCTGRLACTCVFLSIHVSLYQQKCSEAS